MQTKDFIKRKQIKDEYYYNKDILQKKLEQLVCWKSFYNNKFPMQAQYKKVSIEIGQARKQLNRLKTRFKIDMSRS